MKERNDFATNLRNALEAAEISQSAFARSIGVTPQAVQHWCAGNAVPHPKKLEAISQALGIPPSRLMYGKDSAECTTTLVVEDGVISVPLFSVEGSCGTEELTEQGQFVKMIRAEESWIKSVSPSSDVKHLEIITASGDSMAPTICDKDFVLVDRAQTAGTVDGVYVVGYAGTIYIKRIQRQIDGGLLLISDNAKYPPIRVGADEIGYLKIFGRCASIGAVRPI